MRQLNWRSILLAVVLCSATACKQSIGDRCQVNADCSGAGDESGDPERVICCVQDDVESRLVGGTCQRQIDCELDQSDAGIGDDASANSDGGTTDADSGGAVDAAPTDSSVADAMVADDTGVVTPDATPPSDASSGLEDATSGD